MPDTHTLGSLKEVLSFPFRGPQWQTRLLTGIGLGFAGLFVPIVPGLFVAGYTLRVARQTIRGEEPSLPAWDQWEEMIKGGLRIWLIRLAYLAPGQIVLFGGMLLYFLFLYLPPITIMFTDDPRLLTEMRIVGWTGSMAVLFVAPPVGWTLLAIGRIPLPMALAHFAARGELRAGFRVREWWSLLRVNKLGYLIPWVVVIGLSAIWCLVMIAMYCTFVLSWVALLLMMPFVSYLSLVSAALFGQTYRESRETLQARLEQRAAEETGREQPLSA